MNYERYDDLIGLDDLSVFNFTSVGPEGKISKQISFFPTDDPKLYMLAFGNLTSDGSVDYMAVTNNGDREKILNTVILAMELYIKRYPERWILFWGSTEARTRLYRMTISAKFEDLSQTFNIYGSLKNEPGRPFEKDLPFSCFLFSRKNH